MVCRWLALALVLALPGGCSLLGEDEPDEARIVLEGNAGTPARLIVSRNFLSQRRAVYDDEGVFLRDSVLVLLVEADTLALSLPFDQTYDIRTYRQIYARLLRQDSTGEALTLRLLIDGKTRAEEQLQPGQDSLVVLYNYRNRPLREEPDDV
ncbi:hypothetical protein AWN76_003765 [Rhodothermaceae bacterium RA]|nr:hypothetical protein AWN76_003765 [Rhodothermaceae bacterium RA]